MKADMAKKLRLSQLRPSLLHVKQNSFPSSHIHLSTENVLYNSLLVYFLYTLLTSSCHFNTQYKQSCVLTIAMWRLRPALNISTKT